MTDEGIAIGTEAPTTEGGEAALDLPVEAATDGTAPELASALADDQSESFWSGDVTDLEGDDLARYKSFQSDYTKKTMSLAEQRKSLESEGSAMRDELKKQQADLQQLAVQLQARLAADGTGDRGGQPERVDAMVDLRKEFDSRVQRGEGFDAMVDLVNTLSGQTSDALMSEREKTLQARIDELEGRFSTVETGLAPQRQRDAINRAFDDLRANQYRGEFDSPKVRQEIIKQLDAPDEIVSDLLEAGNVKAAISLLGERAIRQVREGQVVERARRRTEASSPDSPAAGQSTDAPRRKSDYASTVDWLRDKFSQPEYRDLGERLKG